MEKGLVDELYFRRIRFGGGGGGDLPWSTFTGNPLEFDAPKAHSLKSCVVDIEPIQSGSGDPSPDNVRPISGWTGAKLWDEAEYDAQANPKLTLPFGQTVYGGTLDLTTGVLTVDRAKVSGSDISWTLRNSGETAPWIRISNLPYYWDNSDRLTSRQNFKCNKARTAANSGTNLPDFALEYGIWAYDASIVRIYIHAGDTITEATAYMADCEICYKLATPTTIQLTPTEVDAIVGRNAMWTDCNNLTVEAKGTAVELNALQSLNILLGNRYINNHTADDVDDDEALNIILGSNER